jgi:pseudaminic acid cytidylyltransferase
MTTICIIPARGGSRRIPGKNWRDFHGKPIIQYSIETAIRSGLFDHVVVSTDHEKIAEISHRAGAVVVWRPAALAEDQVGTQEVASCTLAMYRTTLKHACCIYPTAPMMTPSDLDIGRTILKNNEGRADFAMSVGTEPLRDAGQWYWGTAEAFLNRRKLITHRTIMMPIPETRVCDINTEQDWQSAENMYAALKRKNDD